MTDFAEQSYRISMPVAWRNREPILAALTPLLPKAGLVLEVASGSGEHVLHFARQHPELEWQPSDLSAEARALMAERIADSGLRNILPPVKLDALQPKSWPLFHADAMLAINLLHISPWAATAGLFEGGARLLRHEAPLFLYGPFLEDEVETAPSNLDFDAGLRAHNPDWGLRRTADVGEIGNRFGFAFERRFPLPANNLLLLFRRKEGSVS